MRFLILKTGLCCHAVSSMYLYLPTKSGGFSALRTESIAYRLQLIWFSSTVVPETVFWKREMDIFSVIIRETHDFTETLWLSSVYKEVEKACVLLLKLLVCQRFHLYVADIILYILAPTLFRKTAKKVCDRKIEMWYNPNNSSMTLHSSYHHLSTHLTLLLNPSWFLRLLILAGLRSGCIRNGRFCSDSMSNMREIPCLQWVFKMRLLISLCKRIKGNHLTKTAGISFEG